MKNEIDISRLSRKVLSFFGLELRWMASARQIWIIEAITSDLVIAYMESPTGELLVQPPEVTCDSLFLKSRVLDDYKIVYRTFIEALGSIKKLCYGLDVKTLAPKKILYNPFFKCRSLEEIAVKLYLLVGEKER